LIRRSFGPDSSTKTTRLSRYGYRKVAALLRQAGWTINDKRVERIWQRRGRCRLDCPSPPAGPPEISMLVCAGG